MSAIQVTYATPARGGRDTSSQPREPWTGAIESPLVDQIEWMVDRLRPFKALVSTIHERASRSAHVAAWHTRFHAAVEQLVEAQRPVPLSAQYKISTKIKLL